MLIERGLGISLGWCERLASDEPEACADLAHLNPSVRECAPAPAANTYLTFTYRAAYHDLVYPADR